jgi:hypothetical protein
MLILMAAALALGFTAGTYLAFRFLPPLADTREGLIATWIVRLLFGCAGAWACSELYYVVRAYVGLSRIDGSFQSLSEIRSNILTGAVKSILAVAQRLWLTTSTLWPSGSSTKAP